MESKKVEKTKEVNPQEEYAKARQEQVDICGKIINQALKDTNCRLSMLVQYDMGQTMNRIIVIDNILNLQAK